LPDFICNTSPLQYLHQLGRINLLPALTGGVIVPVPVARELEAGTVIGWDVPDPRKLPWITIRQPASAAALPLAADLGRGEAGVLALALELKDPVVILDDGVGRRVAELLGVRLTGTLGLLLDAKKKGLISAVLPVLDELTHLRFRVSPATRAAVLKLAGESGHRAQT
jgi:predicted nucleic acid-binding protein